MCYASFDIHAPEGDGTMSAVFGLPDPTAEFSIIAGSAGWPAEPFILGPWHDSLPFTTWDG